MRTQELVFWLDQFWGHEWEGQSLGAVGLAETKTCKQRRRRMSLSFSNGTPAC